MNLFRTLTSIFIGLFLLAGTFGTLGAMAANEPDPDKLPSTFTMAAAHVGDRGTYSGAQIRLVGEGYEVLEEEAPVLTFRWTAPRAATDTTGQRIWSNILESGAPDDDVPSWWALEAGTGRVVAKAFGSVRNGEEGTYMAPRDPADDDGVRYACGLWSSLMGTEIKLDGAHRFYRNCAWGGTAWEDDLHFRPVAQERLGDLDTVLFTKRRTVDDLVTTIMGEAPNEYHVWYAKDIPYPVRMAYSWDEDVYQVFRLTHFERGLTPLAQQGWSAGPSVPLGTMAPAPDHGVDERGIQHPFKLSDALAAARQHDDAQPLRDYLSAGKAVVAFAEGVDVRGADPRFTWTIDLWNGQKAFGMEVSQRPPAAVDLPVWQDVSFATRAPMETQYPDVDEPRPTAASLWAAWKTHAGRPSPNTYGVQLLCSGDACERGHVITWGGHAVVHESQDVTGTQASRQTSYWEHRAWRYTSILGDQDRDEWALTTTRTVDDAPAPLSLAPATGQSDVPDDAGSIGIGTALWSWPRQPSAYVGASLLALGAATLYYFWPALKVGAVGLFSRTQTSTLLEHPVRRRIHQAVESEPGIHTAQLRRLLGTGAGALQHHVDKLVKAGLLTRVPKDGYTCHFLRGSVDHYVMQGAGALRAEAARRILAAAVQEPGISASAAARAAGVSPGTATHHIKRLEAAGLLCAERLPGSTRLRPTHSGDGGVAIAA